MRWVVARVDGDGAPAAKTALRGGFFMPGEVDSASFVVKAIDESWGFSAFDQHAPQVAQTAEGTGRCGLRDTAVNKQTFSPLNDAPKSAGRQPSGDPAALDGWRRGQVSHSQREHPASH